MNKAYSKITNIFLILLASVFLLGFGASGYQDILKAKYILFLCICGGYVCLMILLSLESKLIGASGKNQLRIKGLSAHQIAACLFIIFAILSAFLSDYFPETLIGTFRKEGLISIAICSICFLIVSKFGSLTKSLIIVSLISITIFCIICILQFYGLNPLGLYPDGLNYLDSNVAFHGEYLGTIGNADLVAAFLSLTIPILLIGAVRLHSRKSFILLIPLALMIFVLFKSNVSSGILGVLAGVIITAPFAFPFSKKIRIALCIAIAIALICILLFVYITDFNQGMLYELHEILHGNFDDSFGSSRVYIWRNVLSLVSQNILLGHGPDTLGYAEIEPFTKYVEEYDLSVSSQIDIAHNDYLNMLYCEGILELATYLFLIGYTVYLFVKQQGKSVIVSALGAGIVSYSIQGFFGINIFIVSIYFWIALALFFAYCKANTDSINNGDKAKKHQGKYK